MKAGAAATRRIQTLPTPAIVHSKGKFKEGKMRCRQITRMSSEMVDTIKNLERIMMKAPTATFVSPMESETRKKRWMDFLRDAKRSLYTWKREVNQLTQIPATSSFKQEEKFLRMLSATTRSLLNFLKGLEKYSQEIQMTSQGSGLLRDTVALSHRLLYVISLNSFIGSPKLASSALLPSTENKQESKLSSSYEDDTEIATSDLNSDVVSLLRPEAIKKRFSRLVAKTLPRHLADKNSKIVKILAPLKQGEGTHVDHRPTSSSSPPKNRTHHPSVSLRREAASKRAERLNETYDCIDANGKEVPDQLTNLPSDLPDKMADAFLQRVLPYLHTEGGENDIASVSTPLNLDELEIPIQEMSAHIEDLSSRFSRLVNAAHKIEEFTSSASSTLTSSESDMDVSKRLSDAIAKANLSLEKSHEMDYAVLPQFEQNRQAVESTRTTAIKPTHDHLGQQPPIPNRKESGLATDAFARKIYQEVEKQREEFWSSLVRRKFVSEGSKSEAMELIRDCLEEVNMRLISSGGFRRDNEVPSPPCNTSGFRTEATQVGSSFEQKRSTDDDKMSSKKSHNAETSTSEESISHKSQSTVQSNSEGSSSLLHTLASASSGTDIVHHIVSVEELNVNGEAVNNGSNLEFSLSIRNASQQLSQVDTDQSDQNSESYSQDFSNSTPPSSSGDAASVIGETSNRIVDKVDQDSTSQKMSKCSLVELASPSESSLDEMVGVVSS